MRIIIPIGAEVTFRNTDICGVVINAIIGKVGTDYNVGYWIENDYLEGTFTEDQIDYEKVNYLTLLDDK